MEKCPKPVNKYITEKILDQMNNTFCILNQKDESIAFFCCIKYKNEKIPVIIINNYLNNENIKHSIDILINKESKKVELYQVLYKNKEYNITIILIKKNKNIKYIEIDDNLYGDKYKMLYNK